MSIPFPKRTPEALTSRLPERQRLPANPVVAPPRLPGTGRRPLMSMNAAMGELDLDEDDVLVLIDEGSLLWAWDIAGKGAGSRTVRVLTESIEDLVYSRKRPYTDDESEWLRVASLVFPDKPVIVTYELARSLNCGRQLAVNLVHTRQLKTVPGTRIRSGPCGSAQIVTASAKEWLRKRRML